MLDEVTIRATKQSVVVLEAGERGLTKEAVYSPSTTCARSADTAKNFTPSTILHT